MHSVSLQDGLRAFILAQALRPDLSRCARVLMPLPCCYVMHAEGTFRPERIRAIAARFNLDTEAVLDNVSVLHHATSMACAGYS